MHRRHKIQQKYTLAYYWVTNFRSHLPPQLARFMGPTWGPSGAERTQVGPMLAPWTMLSGAVMLYADLSLIAWASWWYWTQILWAFRQHALIFAPCLVFFVAGILYLTMVLLQLEFNISKSNNLLVWKKIYWFYDLDIMKGVSVNGL